MKEAIVSFLNNLLTSKTGFSIFYELKVFTVLNSPLEFWFNVEFWLFREPFLTNYSNPLLSNLEFGSLLKSFAVAETMFLLVNWG